MDTEPTRITLILASGANRKSAPGDRKRSCLLDHELPVIPGELPCRIHLVVKNRLDCPPSQVIKGAARRDAERPSRWPDGK